jgi:hypothetical protein
MQAPEPELAHTTQQETKRCPWESMNHAVGQPKEVNLFFCRGGYLELVTLDVVENVSVLFLPNANATVMLTSSDLCSP